MGRSVVGRGRVRVWALRRTGPGQVEKDAENLGRDASKRAMSPQGTRAEATAASYMTGEPWFNKSSTSNKFK